MSGMNIVIDMENKTVEVDTIVELGYIISSLNELGINNYSIFKIVPKQICELENIIDNFKQLKLFNDGE